MPVYPGAHKLYSSQRLGALLGEMVFDGTHGWASNSRIGLRTLEGEELVDARRNASLPEILHFSDFFDHMELTKVTRVGGHEAYVVLATSSEGSPWTIYFDSKTAYRIRVDLTHATPNGPEHLEIYYDDYRQIPGRQIRYPYHRILKTPQYTMDMQIKNIDLNVPVDESLFKEPSMKMTIQQ